MPQRSFRLSDEDLAHLVRIAEHLAVLDRRAPNQTRALSWAIARALDAIGKADAAAKEIPEGIATQLVDAAELLRALSEKWRRAGYQARDDARKVQSANSARDRENEQLRKQVANLEAELERARAQPYGPSRAGSSEEQAEAAREPDPRATRRGKRVPVECVVDFKSKPEPRVINAKVIRSDLPGGS
jgi:hypothetical protein